jgi:subtilase family serine protease
MTGLPNVPIHVMVLDGYNGIPYASWRPEAVIDIAMAASMAPGLAKVVVFDAGSNGLLADVLNAMVNQPQIQQFSSSAWGFVNSTAN